MKERCQKIVPLALLLLALSASPVFASSESAASYGALSLVPPVLAILLALLTRQVVLSLLIGTFVGATIMTGFNPFYGFIDTFNVYVSDSMTDPGHAAILAFSITLGGMVTLVAKMGGTQAIANRLAEKAGNARGAQVITALLGCIVFFDDLANILVVGPTMRPLTDRLGVSREKLTYLVHTTAGIVAGIAVLTTWIGMEMGLVADAFAAEGYKVNAFAIILKNIPFMFYNIFAIVISFAAALMLKDFGPMYHAEKRTRLTGKLYEDDARISASAQAADDSIKNGKIYYAVVPILTLVAVIFFGLWYAGYQEVIGEVDPFTFEGFRTCFGEADPMPVTVWAAVISTVVAALIAKFSIKLTISEIYNTWIKGATDLFEVMVILVLAWAVGGVVTDIGTADYLVDVLASRVQGEFIPVIVFVVACIISFSTGTSWGTMPIIFPIAIPLAIAYVNDPTESTLVIATIAAVLSGCIFGDQTSPISDSTILSASTSGCDQLHHVKTQIPYALVPAGFAVTGYLLVTFLHLHVGLVLLLGGVGTFLFLKIFGKSTKLEDLQKEAA